MSLLTELERLYSESKRNKWLRYFAIFCRIALALGFIPSGIVKVRGERFYRPAIQSSSGSLFRRVTPDRLLLHVHRRRPADSGASVAHPQNSASGSDLLLPHHFEHLCVDLCCPVRRNPHRHAHATGEPVLAGLGL